MATFEVNGERIEMKNLGSEETAKRIRKALKSLTGQTWSVTQGKGTSGYITITAPPARKVGNIENPDFDFDNTDYWYRQQNESHFDYCPLTPDLKRQKYYNTSEEDAKVLGGIFADNPIGEWLIAPFERAEYVHYLENYDAIKAEEEMIFELTEEALAISEAKRDAMPKQEVFEITEEMIETITDNTSIIKVAEPNSNKREHLNGYLQQYDEGDYREISIKATWQLNLTNEQYDKYSLSLMSDQKQLSGKFEIISSDTNQDEWYYKVVKVVAQKVNYTSKINAIDPLVNMMMDRV